MMNATMKSLTVAGRRAGRLSVRFYRGQAGPEEPKLSAAEQALYNAAQPKSEEIYKRHVAMPKKLNEDDDLLEVRRKRLVYRSKQRGWLEVDLLLGSWAHNNVKDLNAQELDEFEDFVNEETIDIYNIITLRVDIPEHMRDNGVVHRIQEWARQSPLGKADPDMYKKVKTDTNLV